jgi:hypothetical protein
LNLLSVPDNRTLEEKRADAFILILIALGSIFGSLVVLYILGRIVRRYVIQPAEPPRILHLALSTWHTLNEPHFDLHLSSKSPCEDGFFQPGGANPREVWRAVYGRLGRMASHRTPF